MVEKKQLEGIQAQANIILKCSEEALKTSKGYEDMSREDLENYNEQLSSIVMATDEIQDIMMDF